MHGELASLGAALCWAFGLTLFQRDVRDIGARAVNLFKGIVGCALVAGIATLTWVVMQGSTQGSGSACRVDPTWSFSSCLWPSTGR